MVVVMVITLVCRLKSTQARSFIQMNFILRHQGFGVNNEKFSFAWPRYHTRLDIVFEIFLYSGRFPLKFLDLSIHHLVVAMIITYVLKMDPIQDKFSLFNIAHI